MKCFVRHTGQNFERCFGPFDSVDAAYQWLHSPTIVRAGVRGAVVPMFAHDTPVLELWNLDEWEQARALRQED